MALVRMTKEQGDRLLVEIVGEQGQGRASIKRLFARLNPPVEIAEVDPASETTEHGESDLSMVIFGSNEAASIKYLHDQASKAHHGSTVAILPSHSSAAMRRVMQAGADDVLFEPFDADDLRRLMARVDRDRGRIERGSVYSVAGLCGGVGVTTVAGSLALAMRYALAYRVAVVDLDLQNGGLDAFLHLEPDKTILPLDVPAGVLGSAQLEAALTRHESGVCLLAAPRRIDDCDLVSDATVAAAIDLLRKLFDIVVVDCGRHIDANVVATWERSEEVLLVLDPSVAAARTGAWFREIFATLGMHDIEPIMVLNKSHSREATTEQGFAARPLETPFAAIPRDDQLLERAELKARDPWQIAPDAHFVRGIEDLARNLIARRQRTTATSRLVACRPTAIGPRA
jgi:Flp pilus assembly CpaE family ATPase